MQSPRNQHYHHDRIYGGEESDCRAHDGAGIAKATAREGKEHDKGDWDDAQDERHCELKRVG